MKSARTLLLRANAVFLLVAAAGGLVTDLIGAFLGNGAQGRVLANAPYAAIGFVEAHGLALIIGTLLWRAQSSRSSHYTAVAVHVLLGTSNLVFWQIFIAADMLAMGYVTTTLHATFFVLQLFAALALRAKTGAAAPRGAAHII